MNSMDNNKSGVVKVAVISLVVVIVFVLITVLVVSLKGKMNENNSGDVVITISSTETKVNGEAKPVDYFNEDGKMYLNLSQVAGYANYAYTRDGNKINLYGSDVTASIEIGVTTVMLEDKQTNAVSTAEISGALVEKDGKVYIYSRDLSVIIKNVNISYNASPNEVEIRIGKSESSKSN